VSRPSHRSRRRRRLTWIAGLAAIVAAGCTHLDYGQDLREATGRPDRVVIAKVPFFPQEKYQCGPAAMAMALGWSGIALAPEDLVAEVYTPSRQGSLQTGLIAAARRHGRLAYQINAPDKLLDEIAAGHPVIVLQNLGTGLYPAWHYAVVLGFDRSADAVILNTGTDEARPVAWSRFLFTWERSQYWGLLVLPPGKLPADDNEGAYLGAALGLEQARRWHAAAGAYAAALQRWPDSLGALIGLGNAHIMQNEWALAESTLRQAVAIHPQSGEAANNLAHVLARRGQTEEALEWARRAVAAGGPNQAIYLQTLHEIEFQTTPAIPQKP
jgi:tetratricopeptide (TPR) repeat protein